MKSSSNLPVFITGASGFVGANVTRACVKKGYDVHVLLKSNKNIWRLEEVLPNIHVHSGSLLDFSTLRNIVKKVNPVHIFHFAAYGAYSNQTEIEKIIATNIEGTKNLLLATQDLPYKSFINTGSSSEYGFKSKPMKEGDSCSPISFYAASKLAATNLCTVFAHEFNKPIVTLRLFSVYGPYEEPSRFVPTIMKNLFTKQTIQLTPGKQRRDFVYVSDVVSAYLAASKRANKLHGEIINIGTGKEYSNDDVVALLFAQAGEKTKIDKGSYPKRSWDTSHWVGNITKAKKFLLWKPKFTLAEGLSEMYAWYAQNRQYYEAK